MTLRPRLLPALLALALAPLSPALGAEAVVPDYAVDVPITLGLGAFSLFLNIGPDFELPEDFTSDVQPGGLDSFVPLRLRDDFSLASDVILFAGLTAGLALAVQQDVSQDHLGAHTLLFFEALAINATLTDLTKYAVRRPRPYTYDSPTGEFDDTLSFYSGHSSFSATAMMFTARTLDLTHDYTRGQRLGLYGGTAAVAASVATLRVGAGKHFVTDVLVGLLIGGGIGWLVPELHRSARRGGPEASEGAKVAAGQGDAPSPGRRSGPEISSVSVSLASPPGAKARGAVPPPVFTISGVF